MTPGMPPVRADSDVQHSLDGNIEIDLISEISGSNVDTPSLKSLWFRMSLQ